MLSRFSFFAASICVAASCIWLAVAERCPGQTANQAAPPQGLPAREAPRTLSPLHAFLGIDPMTGEFKPPSANAAGATPRVANQSATNLPTQPPVGANADKSAAATPPEIAADAAKAPTSNTESPPAQSPLRDMLARAAETGELPPGNTVIGDTTVDDLRAQITKAVEERDDTALAAALSRATGGAGYGELFPLVRYAQAATLLLLIYPLCIVLGAIYSAWAGRRQLVRTDRDRRHDARQLRRRLTLACSTAATIGLVWLAGENNFWWNEPRKLLAAIVGTTILMMASAGLRMAIRRATSDHAQRTIEDLRFQHAALCDEVKELRKRLQGDGIPETV